MPAAKKRLPLSVKISLAKKAYESAPDESKELIKYFLDSLAAHSYVTPDSFNVEKEPMMYLDNVNQANTLVAVAKIEVLKRAIDLAHSRLHPFWGNQCPVLRIGTLAKAYNHFLAAGSLGVDNGALKYGNKHKEF
ncbi:hypothetical protein C4561_01705 [candidate division WWE3 bacterium]|uniref:Uncharacterized protein n=1 Tax=candidate division WWE3 bacterium TaxID=2053526 RepID=A0A3A4ZEM8_UNCKA|nr:MAG: hypothetical protein C4561_01705 [candidate division WWE3 bacterium]